MRPQAQEVLKQDPFSGHLFAFRGRRGHLIKILYWDGQGFCLFAKRLEMGRFTWPISKEGTITLTPAQLSMLLEGLTSYRGARRRRPEDAKPRDGAAQLLPSGHRPGDLRAGAGHAGRQ